jgi:hypothetical protein
VPNESHEAQHNIDVLTTTMDMAPAGSGGGAGTPGDPRRRDDGTGLWWEIFTTMAGKKKGRHYVAWAFDPEPGKEVVGGVRKSLKKAGVTGFADQPPGKVTFEPVGTGGKEIDPGKLLGDAKFAQASGLGSGLFGSNQLVGAAALDLNTKRPGRLLMRFDLSHLSEGTAAVLHGVQWNEAGEAQGGMTMIALAPT